MLIRLPVVVALSFFIFTGVVQNAVAREMAPVEKSMSETLDLWRDGRFEQLYERLSQRGKTSKETFVNRMATATIRPACCWEKMQNFRVKKQNAKDARVYVKIGLEGAPGSPQSSTREYRLTLDDGVWKMQLGDVFSIAGLSKKKPAAKRQQVKNLPHN